jgi:hypothetical protein
MAKDVVTEESTGDYAAQLPYDPEAQAVTPPPVVRFVHVAAKSPGEMTWAMDQVNSRIAALAATITSIAHAVAAGGAGNPPVYSLVIAYSCAAYAPPMPPIPTYPG